MRLKRGQKEVPQAVKEVPLYQPIVKIEVGDPAKYKSPNKLNMYMEIAEQLAEMSEKVHASAIQGAVELLQQAAQIASLKSQLAFSEARVAALMEEKLCLELLEPEAEPEVKPAGAITQKVLNWESVSPGTTVRQTVGRKGKQVVKEAIFEGVKSIVPKDPADGTSYKSLNAWAVANLKKYAPSRKTFTICVYDKSSGISFLKDGAWVPLSTIKTIVRSDYADGQGEKRQRIK